MVVGAACGAALGAWCGWASGFHHSTTSAFATWAASLGGVVVVDVLLWRGGRGRRLALPPLPAAAPWPRSGQCGSRRTLVGIAPWLALVLVIAAWEGLGIDTGTHQPHLTVSALAGAYRAFDAALLVTWVLVGVGYGVAQARPVAQAPGPPPASKATGLTDRWTPEGRPVAVAVVGHPAVGPALLLPASKAAGIAFWLALVATAVLVELVARRSGGRLATAGELVRLTTRWTAVGVVLAVGWAYGGWHLFAH